MEAPADAGRVAILLATYNGGAFLQPQLESLARQSWASIDVWASDDGSTDETVDALQAFAHRWTKGRFAVSDGPRQGFAANFGSLLANDDIDADFVAFCDQDDVWLPGKLTAACAWLAGQDASRPALYGSRTELIDERDRVIGKSPLFNRPPDLRNALVQSIAGGNTMVFNRAAHRLLRQAAGRAAFLTHDWWAYLLIAAAGGTVHYSPEPYLQYRQHASNLIGSNASWLARMTRLDLLLRGRFAQWIDVNLAALAACDDLLTPEARQLLGEFRRLRTRSLAGRIMALHRTGLYRQTWPGQISLYAAAALNRL